MNDRVPAVDLPPSGTPGRDAEAETLVDETFGRAQRRQRLRRAHASGPTGSASSPSLSPADGGLESPTRRPHSPAWRIPPGIVIACCCVWSWYRRCLDPSNAAKVLSTSVNDRLSATCSSVVWYPNPRPSAFDPLVELLLCDSPDFNVHRARPSLWQRG